jgi:predicted enzyme related to lactoylglutathione lyase
MAFYEAVLGLATEEEYPGVAVFRQDASSSGGALVTESDLQPSAQGALLYYDVTGRHEEAESLVPQFGGVVLTPKHPTSPFAYRSIILDSEGNRLALHSTKEAA